MHLFFSLMIKNKNHNPIRLYQNYGSYLAENERFAPSCVAIRKANDGADNQTKRIGELVLQ